MASDALLTLLPFVGTGGTGGVGTPVSPTNEAVFNVTQSTTAVTSLGVGPNPATSSTVAGGAGSASSNYIDLKTLQGTRKNNPLVAYIIYNSATGSGGTNPSPSMLFTVDHADDNGSGAPGTWQVLHAADQGNVPLTGTAASGQTWITIGRSKRYIRLNCYLQGTTSATVSVSKADIRMAEP